MHENGIDRLLEAGIQVVSSCLHNDLSLAHYTFDANMVLQYYETCHS